MSEKKIYELKRRIKNWRSSNLLNYKIKELKRQIEPGSGNQHDEGQVKDMDGELERYHAVMRSWTR